ncbi:MAG TPA: cyanophycin synthetase, partial [Fimbriimonas sp.]|nr:cyanophycin synthetase [Fimbriimonas sp.]
MTYADAQSYIASLAARGWRLGLDRMAEFALRAGLEGSLGDGSSPKFIHVAGTNGKGSVTAMLQSCLIEQGHRTGAFFSPFVVDPRERIQFGRDLISEADLVALVEWLKPIGESLSETEFGGVTEFEFKTAMGFEHWKRNQADWVALEVGLGGRLDATNIVHPSSCAIVSISLDHTSILGNTVGEIALEKAGIIKPGVPVVIGEMPDEARKAIEAVAKEKNAELWRVGYEVVTKSSGNKVFITTPGSSVVVQPSLFGRIQHHNAAVAYSALELSGALVERSKVADGFARASIPGRFQRIGKFILDGAHNADSAKQLAAMLQQAGEKPKICITGMLTGHKPEEFYCHLRDIVEEFWVVPINFHRAMPPEELVAELH